jgi:hypothetical protein
LEAQSALASLQEIDAGVSRDQSSADGIARTLLDLANEIDARIADDTRLLTTSQSIDLRYWLKITWQNFGDSLLVSARELTQHATSLELQLVRLDQLKDLAGNTPIGKTVRHAPSSFAERAECSRLR